MGYLGRATNIKLAKKINGTHSLTFQLPDKWYDSERGEYVRNEFVEQLFNEKKVKLYYINEWYEFYIKNVQDAKQFKSYMKTYTCSDAFIDELSRNGYGITFDEELYNNVEEIGTFTEEILEDSIWNYSPENNWGDFTEYLEEKMFKIPVSQFEKVIGHKLFFNIDDAEEKIENLFTKEKRDIELGDDLARNKYYWDQKAEGRISHNLIGEAEEVENDGYIYVFYSDLDYCYQTTVDETKINLVVTEEPFFYANGSYAIAPKSVDPSKLIQFMAFPAGAEVEVDEAGLIVNKDYHYVMTIEEWNENIKKAGNYFYKFESLNNDKRKKVIAADSEEEKLSILGNWTTYYEGYLDKIGDLEVLYGKKIFITDRTEINITPEIDQYVKVYNNTWNEKINLDGQEVDKYNYVDLNENWLDPTNGEIDYRICSAQKTRQIVPQLARNLIENASHIKSDDGWGIGASLSHLSNSSMQIKFVKEDGSQTGCLEITPALIHASKEEEEVPEEARYLINFGIVGQEYEIKAGQIYCLGYDAELSANDEIIIAEGEVVGDGKYSVKKDGDQLCGVKFGVYNFSKTSDKIRKKVFRLVKFNKNIKNPYFILRINTTENLSDQSIQKIYSMHFFEAYTKGADQFADEESPFYKYSGRELFDDVLNGDDSQDFESCQVSKVFSDENIDTLKSMIIFEDNVMPGDTYTYTQYFIQQVQASTFSKDKSNKATLIDDTFKQKEFLSVEGSVLTDSDFKNVSCRDLPYSKKDFTDDDLVVAIKVIDLNKCPYYKGNDGKAECDCCYKKNDEGAATGYCMYQKYGYCPYLFQTEKHPRKIRTLKGEKSNRFNLTQELGKVFEVYPYYWINHEENGKVRKLETEMTDEYGQTYYPLDKRIFFVTEKGSENKLGFRYELNLSNITRTIKSDQIVTKLYVQDVDSDISRIGLCSIKTAEDNPSKDSFIIDFSYYIAKGVLDEDTVLRDLYGVEEGDMGYLKNLGYYNQEYDKLSDLIINLSSASFTELEANVNVNFDAIETAQQRIAKLQKQQEKYKNSTASQTYNNYTVKIEEQLSILNDLVKQTFCDDDGNQTIADEDYTKILENYSIKELKENDWVKRHTYTGYGMLGQYNSEYQQIQTWRKQQAEYLKQINALSLRFFRKYEPYLKEGTWSDSNYLTDNAYYFGAKEVAAEGAIPKVEYTITVIDLYALPGYEDYKFDIADTTYVEDIGMFGINSKTGLPNRLKVLISEITYDLDQPKNNSIKIQNFTTQFEDLFQQVSASVQSLSFNENIYKRSSNFTSTQSIKQDSLQGALDSNNLTLINTEESNIEIDKNGQTGSAINNHSNQYRLDGQGMLFSNNGGQTWSVGVGPDGINADYIKTGTLDAGKIRIVDNDYIYFLWDKDGIAAFRNPADGSVYTEINDYALFNKFGLSLIDNSQLRLRAGYRPTSFIGEEKSYNPNDSTTGDIGFYLYDNSGREIFATTTDDEKTARMQILGEMLAYGAGASENPIYTTYYKLAIGGTGRSIGSVYIYDFGDEENFKNTKEIYDNLILYSSPIKLVQNNEEYIYENFLWNWNGTPYYFDESQKEIIYNNQHELEYDGEGVIINDWEGLNLVPYLKTGKIDNNVFLIDNIVDSAEAKSNTPLTQHSYYYYKENDRYVKRNERIYSGNGIISNYLIWKEQIQKTDKDSSASTAGSSGVYINNKIFSEELINGNIYHDYRMFSCLWTGAGNASNILTILRNGTLAIGGFLKGTTGCSIVDIPDEIEIENPQFVVQNDGTVRMDFTKFLDINSNRTVMDIIADSFRSSVLNAINGAAYDLPVYHFQEDLFEAVRRNLEANNTSEVTLLLGCVKTILGIADQLQGKYLLTDSRTGYGYSDGRINFDWQF